MYSAGKKALGDCDRCGFTYKLNDLQYEIQDSIRNGLRVCNSCLDADHPQFKLGELDTSDNENDRLLFEDGTTDPLSVLASHGITLSGQGWNAFQFDNT